MKYVAAFFGHIYGRKARCFQDKYVDMDVGL